MKVCDTNNIITYLNYLCILRRTFFNILKEIFSPLAIQSTMFTIGTYKYVHIKHADFPIRYMYVLAMILRTNTHYFHRQHNRASFLMEKYDVFYMT